MMMMMRWMIPIVCVSSLQTLSIRVAAFGMAPATKIKTPTSKFIRSDRIAHSSIPSLRQSLGSTRHQQSILLFQSSSQENKDNNDNNDNSNVSSSKLPMLLDPGTKGGALFLSLVLFLIPLGIYSIATSLFGFDEIDTGKWIGVGFTVLTCLLWLGTYLFRVATKDMTYAQQLRDYENAVIAKRLEELDDDEVQALVEDMERDEF